MARLDILLSFLLSLLGLAVWKIVSKTSGVHEAWDHDYYFLIGLPVMFVASFIGGYIKPDRPLLWGISTVILQPVALLIQSETGPMIFAGLFFFCIFTGFTIGCAYIGSSIRKSRNKSTG